MVKKRCKLDKETYEKKIPKNPRFICKKCGRVAKSEEKVCKPQKLKT